MQCINTGPRAVAIIYAPLMPHILTVTQLVINLITRAITSETWTVIVRSCACFALVLVFLYQLTRPDGLVMASLNTSLERANHCHHVFRLNLFFVIGHQFVTRFTASLNAFTLSYFTDCFMFFFLFCLEDGSLCFKTLTHFFLEIFWPT